MSLFSTLLPCFVCAGLHFRCSGATREHPSHPHRSRTLPRSWEESLARSSVLCAPTICTTFVLPDLLARDYPVLQRCRIIRCTPDTSRSSTWGRKKPHALPRGKGERAQRCGMHPSRTMGSARRRHDPAPANPSLPGTRGKRAAQAGGG